MAFAPTIHSIGDAQFLSQVLNAVAMIIGTNDFVQLVSIGFQMSGTALQISLKPHMATCGVFPKERLPNRW